MKLKSLKIIVTSLPNIIPLDGVHRVFVLGKHHREPFDSRKAWCVQKRLELVHSDLYYMNKPSLASENYILTFIGDFSRITWVYFLKNKSQVFERFKEFRALDEKQYG